MAEQRDIKIVSRWDASKALVAGQYADLRGADLSGANLRGAYLSVANLRGANLSGAEGLQPERVQPLLFLHDQPGTIRLYKLVNEMGEGVFNGGIKYQMGATVEGPDCDTDVNHDCGAGLNIATLAWCLREWREGYRILVVEFTAADIAAIPTASDGKLRVRRLTVVGEKDLTALGLTQRAVVTDG